MLLSPNAPSDTKIKEFHESFTRLSMRSPPPVSCILAFETVVRHGKISQAAIELSLTASAVSHRISLLETLMKVKLFSRGRHGLTLTPAGIRYSRALGSVMDQLRHASLIAHDQDADRSVTILGPSDYLSLCLLPRLKSFVDVYPGISVSIYESQIGALQANNDSDLQIRDRPSDSRGLVVESLRASAYFVYGSPRMMKNQRVTVASDLLSYPLIRTVTSSLSWETWFSHQQVSCDLSDHPAKFLSESSLFSLQAAASGIGLVLECSELAESFEQNGLLVRVLGKGDHPLVCRYHLVHSVSVSERPSVVLFRRWFVDQSGLGAT